MPRSALLRLAPSASGGHVGERLYKDKREGSKIRQIKVAIMVFYLPTAVFHARCLILLSLDFFLRCLLIGFRREFEYAKCTVCPMHSGVDFQSAIPPQWKNSWETATSLENRPPPLPRPALLCLRLHCSLHSDHPSASSTFVQTPSLQLHPETSLTQPSFNEQLERSLLCSELLRHIPHRYSSCHFIPCL